MPEFTEYAPGTPCWVHVTSPELDRTISFYSEPFGWEADADPRPEAGGYTMFTKDGQAGRRRQPAAARRGCRPTGRRTSRATTSTRPLARSATPGSSATTHPFDVLILGCITVAQDPTGAVFGIWQAGEHHGAELANEPGSFTWNEVQTPDAAAAEGFYSAVFGYEIEVGADGRRCQLPRPQGRRQECGRDVRARRRHGRHAAELGDRVPLLLIPTRPASSRRGSAAPCPSSRWTSRRSAGTPCSSKDPVGAVFQVLANPQS